MPNYVKNEKGYSKLQLQTKAIKEAYRKKKSQKKFPTSVSLPEEVISRLKRIALDSGVPYQSIMRRLIIEGLEKLDDAA